MKLSKSVALVLVMTALVSASCSKTPVKPSSSAGALTANSAVENVGPRPFERHMLTSSGFHTMNEFIRPEIRSRMDEEPVGDSDTNDPVPVEPGAASDEHVADAPPAEAPAVEEQTGQPEDLETGSPSTMKFSWARKSFGDAVKANLTATGVIVVYADEKYYDVERLVRFVEEGRDRIAKSSEIGGERVQVVFGGYRGVPQVELWVVPEGSFPQLKPENRSKASEPEN